MNIQTFADNGKQIVLGLLAVSTIGMVTPARADDALIQESVQESVITGADNVSIQNSNQSNQQHTEYRDRYGSSSSSSYDRYGERGNTGIVQRSDQYCDQVGEYNTCVQDAQQINSSHIRRERPSRY